MKASWILAIGACGLIVSCDKEEPPKAEVVVEPAAEAAPATPPPAAGIPVEAETEEIEEPEEDAPTPGERLDGAIEKTGDGLKVAGEKTKEGVGVALEKTGGALETAGEKTEEGLRKAGDATGRWLKRVGEKIEDAATPEDEEVAEDPEP